MACPKVIGVIPARFNSSRFPAKVLTSILGKSLVQRTYENARQATLLEEVVVAVDDQKVWDHVISFGGRPIMTAPECESGTARCASVIQSHFPDATVVVNIQADEPCLPPEIIDTLVRDLLGNSEAVMTTPVVTVTQMKEVFNPASVKCVFDTKRRALYFSRAPIPYPHKSTQEATYYRHIGLYCFRKEFLLRFLALPSSSLRETEDLEQLKILEHGYPIYVSVVNYGGFDVNHPEDVQKVEEFLCKKENTSLSPVA